MYSQKSKSLCKIIFEIFLKKIYFAEQELKTEKKTNRNIYFIRSSIHLFHLFEAYYRSYKFFYC